MTFGTWNIQRLRTKYDEVFRELLAHPCIVCEVNNEYKPFFSGDDKVNVV